jgi:hypothetical protein
MTGEELTTAAKVGGKVLHLKGKKGFNISNVHYLRTGE